MNKVLVIGAGAQGGPCASILAGEEGVEKILLGDIDLNLAQKVADKIGSQKVDAFKLDASSEAEVAAAARNVDVIINLTHLKFNDVIMSAALAAKTHYVDTATDTQFLEDWITGAEHKLDREFKTRIDRFSGGQSVRPPIAFRRQMINSDILS